MTREVGLSGWARLLVDSMIDAGLRRVVLSPGSRSTPLAWALLERRELECLSVLDERSAGFLAVGQSKMTGRPSLLLSTSGTAAANFYPSVVEAANSFTPLLVLTADRPWELADCEAPQTIDQVRLYGTYARAYVELGTPDDSIEAARGLRRRTAQAMLRSRSPTPGPVHVNARLRKPLEPLPGAATPARASGRLDDVGPPEVFCSEQPPDPRAIAWIARRCQEAERGLIVCGAALPWQAVAPEALARLAEVTGFSVLAEATSQQRFAGACAGRVALWDGHEALLRSQDFRRFFRPDCVLCFGAPLLSSGWERLIRENPAMPRHAIHPWGWPDTDNGLASLTLADPTLVAVELTRALAGSASPAAQQAWREKLVQANQLGWRAVEAHLERGWNEGRAVRTVIDSLTPGSLLALGSSLPVREADVYARARPSDVAVWSQRGTNGIDGLLSGAIGAALASRRPTVLLLGDLSFLHDLGGLWAARQLDLPLVVVVLNNQGGRIFEQLPVAACAAVSAHFASHWLLEHDLDLGSVANAMGVRSKRVTDPEGLGVAMGRALGEPVCTVLEVTVPPRSAADLFTSIVAQVDRDFALAEPSLLPGSPT